MNKQRKLKIRAYEQETSRVPKIPKKMKNTIYIWIFIFPSWTMEEFPKVAQKVPHKEL